MLHDEVTLKSGKIAKLYHHEDLRDARAVPLMLRTYAEMIDKGFNIRYGLGFTNDSSMIWAEVDNVPVGGICFVKWGYSKTHWIALSFTDPAWRGEGINYHCHMELEQLTRERGFLYIASLVSVNNLPRIKSCERVGLQKEFYRMSKRIV